jgi:hypothetical protein
MQQYEKCFNYLKDMKERGIIITPYIDKEIVRFFYYFRSMVCTRRLESPPRRKNKSRKLLRISLDYCIFLTNVWFIRCLGYDMLERVNFFNIHILIGLI